MIADIWQWTPLMFLILPGGSDRRPRKISSAPRPAAGRFLVQRFVTIMLPRIKIVIVIALAIRVVEIFKISIRSS